MSSKDETESLREENRALKRELEGLRAAYQRALKQLEKRK
nr:MAG TPA: protein of unknown function (DUF5320) [Caudoviricetes sp.]